MDILFSIGIVLFAGLIFGKIMKAINQPDIIGYLIAGILIGPSVLKLVSFEQLNSLNAFGVIALSFIAFLIGSQFKLKYVKKMGSKPFVIAILGALLTLALVTNVLYFIGCSISMSLILGAISSATAPAVTMIIIKQYKAKGDLTNTILSVIAIDDVLSIIIFGFCLVFAENLVGNELSLVALIDPFFEVLLSILMGIGLGLILGIIIKYFKNNNNIITLIVAFVFITIGVSEYYHVSPLLICMIMGGVFINYFQHKTTDKVLDLIDYITPPILVIFFVISGASLDFTLLPTVGMICLFYVIARTIGKILGASVGAIIVKDQPKIVKYLGPTLLSQTGLAVGLVIVAADVLPETGTQLQTIVIATSFIFDIFTPVIIKTMLKKAKEIK